jgi:hypothetical protein
LGGGGVIAADGVGGEGWGFGFGFGVGVHGVVVRMDLVCGRGFISMIREFSRGEVEGWDFWLRGVGFTRRIDGLRWRFSPLR